jgi:trehalose-6-phosphatase
VAAQQSLKSYPDLKLEIKETSLRVATQNQRARRDLEKWAKLFTNQLQAPWVLILGHRGAELIQSSCHKGTAIKHALGQKTLKGRRPIALGDDLMDKSAMQAALDAGGYAVAVGDACGWVTELTHKPDQLLFFETPARLHDALRSWF